MKKLISLLAVAFAFSFGMTAHAAGDDAKTTQQSKMKTCNADAKDKKGDERKAFMKECLSAKAEPATQQSKMKTCNVDAKDKKGDERKAFMKECLSKKPA
jgi:Tfp pilus assembly protein PilE